ncbi:hypothetical protein [Burkholderia sp. Bp8986]|uniref:hypothetical protein n=1 Tax=Burkholderia sp. Bp8986 TaxID=2184550 RepID=UPI000F5AE059|nr:hypothetical protein [Burkholderia sp. Bp8986]RQS42343.1 hypothetical protein DID99_35840 [Burkholderia sp. Bp8986]
MTRLHSGLSRTNIQQQFQMLISCVASPTGTLRIDGIEYQIRNSSDGISISISSDERRKRVGFISSLLPVQRSEIAFIEQIRQGFEQAVEPLTRGERIPVDEPSLPGPLS